MWHGRAQPGHRQRLHNTGHATFLWTPYTAFAQLTVALVEPTWTKSCHAQSTFQLYAEQSSNIIPSRSSGPRAAIIAACLCLLLPIGRMVFARRRYRLDDCHRRC